MAHKYNIHCCLIGNQRVDKWRIQRIMKLYDGLRTSEKVNGIESEEDAANVDVHQGS